MRVTIVGDYPRTPDQVAGGVESVILYLTQSLQAYPDVDVSVVTLERWGRGTHSRDDGGVQVDYVDSSKLPSRLYAIINTHNLQKAIAAQKPDLIHAHIAGEYASASSRVGKPWILTLHGIRFLEASLQPGLLNRYREWFIRRDEFGLVGQADHIVSISPFVDAAFNGHIHAEVSHIENPISADFFELPPVCPRKQILYAGRLIPRKDILTLLHAFALVHNEFPDATLRIAGGPTEGSAYVEELKQFIQDASLEDSVFLLGSLSEEEVLHEYSNCSIFSMASVLETAPMVIMQALAAGRPVVATDVGGVRELVDHEKTGLVVPKQNSQMLADALKALVGNADMVAQMGTEARKAARQRFHADVVAQKTKQLYTKVVN